MIRSRTTYLGSARRSIVELEDSILNFRVLSDTSNWFEVTNDINSDIYKPNFDETSPETLVLRMGGFGRVGLRGMYHQCAISHFCTCCINESIVAKDVHTPISTQGAFSSNESKGAMIIIEKLISVKGN